MRLPIVSVLTFVSLAFVLLLPPASAETSLETGMKLYKEKNYKAAKGYLSKAAKEDPKSWKAHLFLGHTYMTLGNVSQAKNEYLLCKGTTNHPTVQKYCSEGLAQVKLYYSKLKGPAAASKPKPKADDSDSTDDSGDSKIKPISDDDTEDDTNSREAQIKKKRDAIIKKAEDKCKALEAELKAKMEKRKVVLQERFSDKTQLDRILNQETKAEKEQIEKKCKKIMDEAKRNARTYR